MNSTNTMVRVICLTIALVGCSHPDVKTNGQEHRPSGTSAMSRKQISARVPSCERAYQGAVKSAMPGDAVRAVEICQKAAEAACIVFVQNYSSGPTAGDEDLIGSTCELAAAYGGNKAANRGQATPKCESIYRSVVKGTSKEEFNLATNLCNSEESTICNSSDCILNAAHGAFVEVSKKK